MFHRLTSGWSLNSAFRPERAVQPWGGCWTKPCALLQPRKNCGPHCAKGGQTPFSLANTLKKQHETPRDECGCSSGGFLESEQHLRAEQASNHKGRAHRPWSSTNGNQKRSPYHPLGGGGARLSSCTPQLRTNMHLNPSHMSETMSYPPPPCSANNKILKKYGPNTGVHWTCR